MSHFNKFVMDKLQNDPNEGDEYTHLSMIGGKWRIGEENIEEFRNVIRMCYRDNMPLSIVECKTPIFRYFIDIDFISNMGLKIETMKEYVKDILRLIKECFIEESGNMDSVYKTYGYMTSPRPKIKNNEEYIKTGCHVYIPGLHVDGQIALGVRMYIVKKMTELHPLHKWNEIIDESVYKGPGGLRLPYTSKLEKCKCKIKKACGLCANGTINDGGIYLPVFVLNGGVLDEDKDILEKLKSNIRLSLSKSTIQLYNNYNKAVVNQNIIGQYTKRKRIQPTKIKEGLIYSDNNISGNIIKLIESFIRDNIHCYKTAKITGVSKVEFNDRNGVQRCQYLINTDSKWCQNINKAHRSNHIYFMIKPNGDLVQKCFCTCETLKGRSNGWCKNFESRGITIKNETKIVEELFNASKQNMIINSPSDLIHASPDIRNRHLNTMFQKLQKSEYNNDIQEDCNENDLDNLNIGF